MSTEPTTPTGKRYADTGATKALAFIAAIENEAREQGAREERERLIDKAHTFRSMFSESEWGSVCFLLYVESVRPLDEPTDAP